jgi:hypothetical protein
MEKSMQNPLCVLVCFEPGGSRRPSAAGPAIPPGVQRSKEELLSLYLTQGNADDRNAKHIKKLAENLFGKLFGDKDYLSQAPWKMLFAGGIQLFSKQRKI